MGVSFSSRDSGIRFKFDALGHTSHRYPCDRFGRRGNSGALNAVLTEGKDAAALVASMVHYGAYTVQGIKGEMARTGLPVRGLSL